MHILYILVLTLCCLHHEACLYASESEPFSRQPAESYQTFPTLNAYPEIEKIEKNIQWLWREQVFNFGCFVLSGAVCVGCLAAEKYADDARTKNYWQMGAALSGEACLFGFYTISRTNGRITQDKDLLALIKAKEESRGQPT
jgi:hypothetical protein